MYNKHKFEYSSCVIYSNLPPKNTYLKTLHRHGMYTEGHFPLEFPQALHFPYKQPHINYLATLG